MGEIEFAVVGNMSLGKLQQPSKSRLRILGPRAVGTDCDSCVQLGTKVVASCNLQENDPTSRVAGTLTYDGVPYSARELGFTFGQSGYSELLVKLRDASD